jgi:hypothetical protein
MVKLHLAYRCAEIALSYYLSPPFPLGYTMFIANLHITIRPSEKLVEGFMTRWI